MKISRRRTVVVCLFFAVLCFASLIPLSTRKGSIVRENRVTEEEVKDISRSASLVVGGLADSTGSGLDEVDYRNSSMVERLKELHENGMYDGVPSGHAVWEVIWHFRKGVEGTYLVIVIIDAETGEIVHEETGAFFL